MNKENTYLMNHSEGTGRIQTAGLTTYSRKLGKMPNIYAGFCAMKCVFIATFVSVDKKMNQFF